MQVYNYNISNAQMKGNVIIRFQWRLNQSHQPIVYKYLICAKPKTRISSHISADMKKTITRIG